jgi:diadenosine tetraphosphatase ApaH/serine/threonine PP2A family protein phosphatase
VETIGKPNARADGEELRIDPDCAYLINPGSVGQPRDGDPRAAYVVFDDENRLVFYGRPEYDVAKAQEKIVHAGLPPLLADRLAFGR